MRINQNMTANDDSFKKVFSKLWGHSGGWLSFSCPHRIVYYLKFILRVESCRDYNYGLLSMAHLLNVCIVDMAHMVARHAHTSRVDDAREYGKANDDGKIFYLLMVA